MPNLKDSLEKQSRLAAAPTLGNHHPDARAQAIARQRLDWLHSAQSSNVDGYEWGVFRVKWKGGKAVEVWQTKGDFSDLDAAMGVQASQTVEPDTSKVICPNCVHQFRAIPQDVQALMLAASFEPQFTKPAAVGVVEQDVERLKSDNAFLHKRRDALKRQVVELGAIAMSHPAQKNAARYKFLRSQPIDVKPGQPVIAISNGMKSGYYLNGENADFAIDAAIAAKKVTR